MSTRPCWVEIHTPSLEHNFRLLQKLAGPETECLAIVKADAYGHSLALCAPAAVRAGARWIGVTSVEEGVAARAVCPDVRILVIGGVFPGQGEAVLKHQLTPVVWDDTQFEELQAALGSTGPGSLPVHLEMDTGMSRQGVALDDLTAVLARFCGDSPFRLQAMMTHLYASDEAGSERSEAQLARLADAVRILRSELPEDRQPEFLSVGATAALLGEDAERIRALAKSAHLKPMMRTGLALYGVTPRFNPSFGEGAEPQSYATASSELAAVLTWKTRVVSVRTVPAGTEIGYNGTFVAGEPMRLALLAVGYADGLERKLGNRFSLLVDGQRAPLVGRVSMDQAVIDVTEIAGVKAGDEVVLIGEQRGEQISAYDHAEAAGTIPWEIFTRIASRVPRIAC